MFHEIEHEVKWTLIFPVKNNLNIFYSGVNLDLPKVHSLLFISDNFSELDDIFMFQLP